jgi:hypothetical protein
VVGFTRLPVVRRFQAGSIDFIQLDVVSEYTWPFFGLKAFMIAQAIEDKKRLTVLKGWLEMINGVES